MRDAEKAATLYASVTELFPLKGSSYWRERVPPAPEDRAVSTLWPFSAAFSALNALCALPGGAAYERPRAQFLSTLEKYWDGLRSPAAYESYPEEFGGGDRFYDDNMWIALDFLDAFDATRAPAYLEKAKTLFTFILSGWSDELGGGIFWCEQKRETKNTCSNGPAVVLALRLYQETHGPSYLEWGKRIYDWTRQKLQAPSGVFWDNVNLAGVVDTRTYTYNTGTMIHSAALLYQATQDRSYLDQGRRMAEAAFLHFTQPGPEGIRFYGDRDPWFTAVLFRGYDALSRIDGDSRYVASVIENIDYAWTHGRDTNGLLSRDWSGRSREDATRKWLLDELGNVELYAKAGRK